MSFMDFLRKSGILRFGAVSGTYTNAKDRPIELQEQGVFNAKKEMTDKQDAKAAVAAVVAAGVPKWLKFASAVAVLFFMLLALSSSMWWLLVIMWAVWFYLMLRAKTDAKIARLPFVLLFVVIIVLSLVIGAATVKDEGDTAKTTDSNVAADETYDCIAKPSDKPKQIAGYLSDVFASAYKDVSVGERRKPTKTTKFKLSDFELTKGTNPAETVYLTVYGSSNQMIPGVDIAIQVCNASTGKTTIGNDLTNYASSPTTDNTSGVETNMSGVQTPKTAGNYNVDGLVRVNGGPWQFVDRLAVKFE